MTGIIFNFEALREYSEGIRVCRGYQKNLELGFLDAQSADRILKDEFLGKHFDI